MRFFSLCQHEQQKGTARKEREKRREMLKESMESAKSLSAINLMPSSMEWQQNCYSASFISSCLAAKSVTGVVG